ncbi:hypothetical protein P171DRAFT_482973 [Karstenula rhodostoma CBS 690.94]|uniref:Uncharacterized protein n=1 Tax=Karstenula rhodostoma CBS 690.94 TaxID=1392251 RepID=A0A9P4PQ85_9PLEO|nr:hypothetical protein P171DRAFT_482973 [Karstenula rhodostoma CBS 690.94]
MSAVANLLEDYSIYIILSLRGAQPGYHWGIFVPTNKPLGEVWHAVNRSGGWSLEIKTTNGIPSSMSLCLVLKVGTATSQNWATLRTTLANVPSSGQPSLNTREAFTCRVWVKDAILALHNAGVIRLTKAIETIEQTALETAEGNRTSIEQGTGAAMVLNSTGFSTTA